MGIEFFDFDKNKNNLRGPVGVGSTRTSPTGRFTYELFRKPRLYGNFESQVTVNRGFEVIEKGEAVQLKLKNEKIDTSIIIKWSSRAPLTLGIEEVDGFSTLIYRGSMVPIMCSGNLKSQIWDRRRIIEGERPRARYSGTRWVGILEIPLLPPTSYQFYPTEISSEISSNIIKVKFNLDTFENLVITVTDRTVQNEITTVYELEGVPTHLLIRVGYC